MLRCKVIDRCSAWSNEDRCAYVVSFNPTADAVSCFVSRPFFTRIYLARRLQLPRVQTMVRTERASRFRETDRQPNGALVMGSTVSRKSRRDGTGHGIQNAAAIKTIRANDADKYPAHRRLSRQALARNRDREERWFVFTMRATAISLVISHSACGIRRTWVPSRRIHPGPRVLESSLFHSIFLDPPPTLARLPFVGHRSFLFYRSSFSPPVCPPPPPPSRLPVSSLSSVALTRVVFSRYTFNQLILRSFHGHSQAHVQDILPRWASHCPYTRRSVLWYSRASRIRFLSLNEKE